MILQFCQNLLVCGAHVLNSVKVTGLRDGITYFGRFYKYNDIFSQKKSMMTNVWTFEKFND